MKTAYYNKHAEADECSTRLALFAIQHTATREKKTNKNQPSTLDELLTAYKQQKKDTCKQTLEKILQHDSANHLLHVAKTLYDKDLQAPLEQAWLQCLQQAANKGCISAAIHLAEFNMSFNTINHPKAANVLLERVIKQKSEKSSSIATAYYYLANLHYHHYLKSYSFNVKLSSEYFLKAATLHHAAASHQLAAMYCIGDIIKREHAYNKTILWLKHSAKLGYLPANALHRILDNPIAQNDIKAL